MNRRSLPTIPLLIAALACSPAHEEAHDWTSYGSDKANTKYAPLGRIHEGNVDRLRVVWRWTSPDEAVLAAHPELQTWAHESTPLAVDGILYTVTSTSQVAALDATSGETLWVHDPETWKRGSPPNMGFVHRGLAYWDDGDTERLFLGTGDGFLIALDAATGKPAAAFGNGGREDLTTGLRRPVDRDLYAVTSPPILCRDTVIVGSSISDEVLGRNMPPGDVRGFDPRTGAPRFTFHTVPQDGPARDTWEDGSWQRTGNTNVWTLMSCDEDLGYVYLAVGTPSNDYYGGDRSGDNLYAESLVALDAETGERVWHQQLVHHGLWDYDLPAAPNLVDLTIDGREVRAVAQVSKQAFCYVFDRVTGEPLWPLEERPVAASEVPDEWSSPTQPYPTRPPAFDRQGVSVDDLIDFTPELRAEALAIVARFQHGPLFAPTTEDRPTLVLPGPGGGASWAGAAFDPRTSRLYVPSVTKASVVVIEESDEDVTGHAYRGRMFLDPPGPRGLPLFKPPYGRLSAIDLAKGEIAWTRAVGRGPVDHPALAGLDLPPLGWPRRSFVLLTESLLFVAQQGEWRLGGRTEKGNAALIENQNHDAFLRALDPHDGRVVAEVPLPGNATGSPMTYVAGGRQYIVLATGGGQLPAELIALGLP